MPVGINLPLSDRIDSLDAMEIYALPKDVPARNDICARNGCTTRLSRYQSKEEVQCWACQRTPYPILPVLPDCDEAQPVRRRLTRSEEWTPSDGFSTYRRNQAIEGRVQRLAQLDDLCRKSEVLEWTSRKAGALWGVTSDTAFIRLKKLERKDRVLVSEKVVEPGVMRVKWRLVSE